MGLRHSTEHSPLSGLDGNGIAPFYRAFAPVGAVQCPVEGQQLGGRMMKHFRNFGEMSGAWESRRGRIVRARGYASSPRNGRMDRTGVREGWKWKWTAVCEILTPPLWPPLKGGIQVPWPVPAGHCSGQPDGAAAQDGMTCAIVGANDYSPLRF